MNLTKATARIGQLRKAYLNESLMAMGEGRSERHVDYMHYGVRCMLFVEGWLQNKKIGNTKLRWSAAEAYRLEHTLPVITPGELIVGQPDMDWTSRYTREQYDELKHIYNDIAVTPFFNREGHIALDYTRLLEGGLTGMLEDVNSCLAALDPADGAQTEKYEFYTCAAQELNAMLTLEEHYVKELSRLAESAQGKQREEYLSLKAVLERVPRFGAATFREALQSIHFYTFPMQGLYSFGRVDDFLYPFYCADIAAGRLTDTEAQELIDCFCMLFAATVPPWAAAGMMVGGLDRAGNPVENELTWMFLNSISHTHLPDPSIGLCVTGQTGEELLQFVSELLAQGESHPEIWNDRIVTERLIAEGIAVEDARQYTHSTCVEVTPIGCSNWQITSPYVNMLEAFLDAFEEFDAEDSLEDMLKKYEAALERLFNRLMLEVNLGLLEKRRNGMIDPALVSCLVRDCIAEGKFKEDCGAVYNRTACDFLGMSNTVESFNVIRVLVLEQKKLTLSELRQAIACNYEGHEVLLQMIRAGVPHYGNNDSESDRLAARIADMAINCARRHRDIYGNPVIPGAFSYDNHVDYGSLTKATPDGRRDYEPLHDGSNPVQGYDTSGPTAMLNSVNAWHPSRFAGGIAVNVKLSRSVSQLPQTVYHLIRGFLSMEIPEIQFSVVSNEELKKAKETPEQYSDLLVRVGGFSDFFVKLDERVQDELIRRSSAN